MSKNPRPVEPVRTQSPPKRWLALDVMRGLAVLSMIQGHTFTALLEPSAYEGAWSSWHKLLHGLTGPMFLLGGGLAYGLVTLPHGGQPSTRANGGRLVRRGLMLIALGYALQVPRVPWARIFAEHELLALLLRVGPLQLVGVCLLVCEAMRRVTRSRAQVLFSGAVLMLVTALCAPWMWSARSSLQGPLWLGMWLDGYAGSVFPFFPWAAFFFLGVVLSGWAGWARATQVRPRTLALGLLSVGLASSAFAYAMFIGGYWMRNIYGDGYELWHTSPLYVLFRAGLVMACLGLLSLCEHPITRLFRALPNLDAVFGVLSRQSLVAYVTHLLVLYGTPLTKGLARIGTTLNVTETSLATAYVLLFTTAITVIWNHAITGRRLSPRVLDLARRVRDFAVRQVDRIGKRERHHPAAPQQPIEP